MIGSIKKHWTNLQNVFEANNKVTKKKVINTILAFFLYRKNTLRKLI